MVDDGFAADEAPDIGIEAAKFLLDFDEGPGVQDACRDLGPVADDAGIGQKCLLFGLVIFRDLMDIKIVIGRAIGIAPRKDRQPA